VSAGLAPARTLDALLGGRVKLLQPCSGYRAATDPVLLAAACPARAGQRVLDLGCGVGAAALCLAARTPGLDIHGLEIDPQTAALARENAAAADAPLTVHDGDVASPPSALRAMTFDQALANPPFFGVDHAPSPEAARDRARREAEGGLAVWIDAALRRLRQGGRLALIHRAERLPEILAALAGRAGEIAVLPLAAREGRPAKRVIVRARKDSAAPFRLAPPLILHAGPKHARDADDYTAEATAILRDAAPLDF